MNDSATNIIEQTYRARRESGYDAPEIPVGEREDARGSTSTREPNALFFPGKTGVLTCTEHQITFDGGRIRTTVSMDTVSSLEFRKPKWSKTYLYAGIASLTHGIVRGAPDSGPATFGSVVGIALLVTGYWLRTSRLAIHTLPKSIVTRLAAMP